MIDYQNTLVILSPGFPENAEDSTCLPAQQSFIRSLNKILPKLKVIILTFQYPHFRSTYEWYGNQVVSFGGMNKKRIHRLLVWLKVWKQLKKINKQENILGLLSLWCTETAFVGKLFASKNKLQHFCWVLGQDARKGNKMVKIINPHPNELIGMSDFLVNEFFRNHGVLPSHMVPNGINPDLFSEQTSPKDIEIIGVGSLIELKRYDIFISIIRKVTDTFPYLSALLCGDGIQKNKLELQIQNLNLQQNLELIGEISHHEVLKLMTRTKIFLHTSSYEGFSGACLEALYAGAHVISFCFPLKANIDHWHVVSTPEEMIAKTIELLKDSNSDYKHILPFKMDDSAKGIMDLFFKANDND
jgi:glycosyltransferase involved in cell wall biosynthesis